MQPRQKTNQEISEFLIPYLHPTPASLLDYLPRQALVLIDDRQSLESAISEIEEQAVAMRRDFVADGTLAEDFPLPYLTLDELRNSLSTHQTLELGPSSALDLDADARRRRKWRGENLCRSDVAQHLRWQSAFRPGAGFRDA